MLQTQGPKSQIIDVLSADFPLTAKKVYNVLKRRYQIGSTYVAVYQHMRELVEQGVLAKSGVEYRLDEKWIRNSSALTENMKASYGVNDLNAKGNDGIESTCMACTNYGTLKKLVDSYRKRFLESIDPNKTNRILWLGNHVWAPFVSPAEFFDKIREINGKGVRYCVAMRGNTKLDKHVMSLYERAGMNNVKTGAAFGGNETITIYNDTMFYIVFPHESCDLLDRLYSESGNLSDFNYETFNAGFLNMKAPFMMFVIKNPAIVKYYTEKIESLFNGR